MLSWIFLTAFAGDLEVERAVDLLADGYPDQAYLAARQETASSVDPTLWLTFFQACDAVGLGPACRAEVAVRGDSQPELEQHRLWHDRRAHGLTVELEGDGLAAAASGRLEGIDLPAAKAEHLGALARKDPDAAAEAATEWLDTHPDHPEVVAAVFDPEIPPRMSLGKVRKDVEKRAKKALKKNSDPVVALRWHRLLKQMGSASRSGFADQLESLLGERPISASPMTRAEQVQRAQAVMKGEAELPTAIPADREAVALKAAAMLSSAGKHDEAATLLQLAIEDFDNLNLELALVDVHLTRNVPEEAIATAERAMTAAVSAWPTDLSGTNRVTRRNGLARAMAARGVGHANQARVQEAVVDLMIANQLAFEPLRAPELEQAMKNARYTLETLKVGLETPSTPAHQVALEQAKAALDAEDFTVAIESASQAIAVLCLPTHRRARLTATLPARPELASAFALRAFAAARAGNPDAARQDLTTAVLLEPWAAPSDWWGELANLREGDAALLADAMAVQMSDEDVKREPRGVTGLPADPAVHAAVSAALVSDWMQGHATLEAKPTGIKVSRSRVIPYRSRAGGGGSGGGGGSRPAINQPFPSLTLSVDGGTVGIKPGRIHLVTFARTDSPSSRRALRELNLLARKMRGSGLDVVCLGIATDEEESALDAVATERKSWGTFAWDPAMGKRFGVSAVPTTWIVDGAGIARFVHVGYLGPSDYEQGIRYVSAR